MSVYFSPLVPNPAVNAGGYTSATEARPETWDDVYALVDANFAALARGVPFFCQTPGDLEFLPGPDWPRTLGATAVVLDTANSPEPALAPGLYVLVPAEDAVGATDPYGAVADQVAGAVEGTPSGDGTERWWVPAATVQTVEVPTAEDPTVALPPRRLKRYVEHDDSAVYVSRQKPSATVLSVDNKPFDGAEAVTYHVRVPYLVSPDFPQAPAGPAAAPYREAGLVAEAGAAADRERLRQAERERIGQALPAYRPQITLARSDESGAVVAVDVERVGAVDSAGTLSMTGSDTPPAGVWSYYVVLQYADAVERRQMTLEVG